MELSLIERMLIELLREMGGTPLHVAFTSTGEGVALTIIEGAAHIAGFGPTAEAAFANTYCIPVPEPEPQPASEAKPSPFRVVGGTDRRALRSPQS